MSGRTISAVIECLIKFGMVGAISYGLYETYGTVLWSGVFTTLLRYFYNLVFQLEENAKNLKNEIQIVEKEIRNMIEVAEDMMFDFGEDSYKCDFYDLDKFEKNWKIWEKESGNSGNSRRIWIFIKLSMVGLLIGLLVETTVDTVFKPLISLLSFPFFSFLLYKKLQTTKWKFEKFEEKCDMLWRYVVFAFDLAHRAEENLEDEME
ncbi:hypothetical protein B9Z55_003573 [Caenorhabditis nigoni]|uniref:Uncharacterized protein n=2 Tax=Caenorhabditis nigoni TaxID=1611254 RepID=A0A2G5VQY9_9PELO|nr:hypothetical protein B9Z55_003573 [Caenorhabditis nigoni]